MRTTIQKWYNPYYYAPDLYHFCEIVAQETKLPLSLRDAAIYMQNYIDGAVIAEWHGIFSWNVHGMTIFLPDNFSNNPLSVDYLSKIDFGQERWTDFLGMYEFPNEALSVVLHPAQTIVSRGDQLFYTIEIINDTWVDHTITLETQFTVPSGNTIPFLGPVTIPISGNQTKQKEIKNRIPM